MRDNRSSSFLSGSFTKIGNLLLGTLTACTVWSFYQMDMYLQFPFYRENILALGKAILLFKNSTLNSIAVLGKYILFINSQQLQVLTKFQAKNGLACASNNKELDAVLPLVLWVHYLETFLAQSFHFSFSITRLTDVSLTVRPLHTYQYQYQYIPTIMFTVDPLSSWNFSSFPLTVRVAKTWLRLPADVTELKCYSTAITAKYS